MSYEAKNCGLKYFLGQQIWAQLYNTTGDPKVLGEAIC